MAMKVQGGRMVPLSRDTIARKDWLRQRELRLKDNLRVGSIEEAAQTLSEIMESAQTGDINPTKAQMLQKAIQDARRALNAVRSAYSGSIVS
jgi:hypothetical protein